MKNYNEIFYKIKDDNNFINNAYLKNNLVSELSHYLAGLIESDGSIIIPQVGSKNTLSVTISFHEDDKPLAEKICNILGYGSLELIPSSKAVKIHIRGKYSILNLLRLINGKFRTPKIEKLNSLIYYINKNWSRNVIEPLLVYPRDESPLNSNSWLSGFSDGDANFYVNINWPNDKKYGQIKLTFEIVQSRLDKEHFEKYKFIMEKIADFCESKFDKYQLSKFDRTGK
jgi:LAGLIDADG endonuclease